jgi:hypothetical protein
MFFFRYRLSMDLSIAWQGTTAAAGEDKKNFQ